MATVPPVVIIRMYRSWTSLDIYIPVIGAFLSASGHESSEIRSGRCFSSVIMDAHLRLKAREQLRTTPHRGEGQ